MMMMNVMVLMLLLSLTQVCRRTVRGVPMAASYYGKIVLCNFASLTWKCH